MGPQKPKQGRENLNDYRMTRLAGNGPHYTIFSFKIAVSIQMTDLFVNVLVTFSPNSSIGEILFIAYRSRDLKLILDLIYS